MPQTINTLLYLFQTGALYQFVSSSHKISDAESVNPLCSDCTPSGKCRALVDSSTQQTVGKPQRNDYRSSVHFPPNDCMVKALEYLGRATDIDNFKDASPYFEKVYDQYKLAQSEKFQALNALFDESLRSRKRYESIEHLLQSVPCIPDVYVDLKNIGSINALSWTHYDLNQVVIRGLTTHGTGVNLPFLSLSLWNTNNQLDFFLLICVFDFDGLAKVIIHSHGRQATALRKCDFTRTFNLQNLNDLLSSKRVSYGEETWNLNTWESSGHQHLAPLYFTIWR